MTEDKAAFTEVAPHQDALTQLVTEHRKVTKSFADFEKLSSHLRKEKIALANKICADLLKHMTIEEEIFYPAVQEGVDGVNDVVNESIVEHAAAKELILAIKDMQDNEALLDSRVRVLGEQIRHHTEEEERELFSKVEKSSLDLEALGQQMTERKNQL